MRKSIGALTDRQKQKKFYMLSAYQDIKHIFKKKGYSVQLGKAIKELYYPEFPPYLKKGRGIKLNIRELSQIKSAILLDETNETGIFTENLFFEGSTRKIKSWDTNPFHKKLIKQIFYDYHKAKKKWHSLCPVTRSCLLRIYKKEGNLDVWINSKTRSAVHFYDRIFKNKGEYNEK